MNILSNPDDFTTSALVDTAPVDLPCVSVIIVNYNYGRFLHGAVKSVFDQTYPNIECVIVDNASTDESDTVLHDIEILYPQVHIIRRHSNDGQTAASLAGFEASRGAYIIFVDADDILLPDCATTHVYVHLSLRDHVGFTCGDMLQVSNDQIVVSTSAELNRYILERKGFKPERIRPYHHPYGAWPDPDVADELNEKIHFVAPLASRWVWSATSGNCFRRDAVRLFSDHPGLSDLRTGTDMYFATAISALCGSVLIDKPVFAYRIHGGNIFTNRAQLNQVFAYQPGCSGDNNHLARQAIIDHLVANPERFAVSPSLRRNFLIMLRKLDVPDIDYTLPRWAKRSRLAGQIVANYKKMASVFGHSFVKCLLIYMRVPLRVVFTLKHP